MQPGGAVNLNFLIRVAKVTSAMAIMGMTAYGIAGCSHTTALTASSSATPAVEPGVTTYLCRFTNEAMLLQWNTSNGSISGTYQDATISGTTPQEQVNTSQGDLGGTTSSSGGITLNIGTETWYGKVSGPSVTLNVPQTDGSIQPVTCSQAAVSDWNSAVSQLNGQVTSGNNTALQQQAQASSTAAQRQAVSNAQQSLASDVSTLENDSSSLNTNTTLAGDISTMKSDYATEQSDYQTEQSDGCPGASGDASAVGSDATAIDTDQSSLQTDIQSLQTSSGGDGISGIRADIAAVNSDLATLTNLGLAPAVDSSGTLAAGNKAISNAQAAIQWANQQASSIDGQAHQLATTAQNWASQHGC